MQKPQEDPQSYKTISAVLRELREEYGHDMPTSPQMNKLLEEAGLIKKIPEPTWFVTQEGIEAGLRQRPIHKGDEYSCPEYSEEAYEVIRKIIESAVSGE